MNVVYVGSQSTKSVLFQELIVIFVVKLFAFVSRRSHFDFPRIAVQLCPLNCLINELLFYNVIFFKFAFLNN